MPYPDNFSSEAFNKSQGGPEVPDFHEELSMIRAKVAELDKLINELGDQLNFGTVWTDDALCHLTECLDCVEKAVKRNAEGRTE